MIKILDFLFTGIIFWKLPKMFFWPFIPWAIATWYQWDAIQSGYQDLNNSQITLWAIIGVITLIVIVIYNLIRGKLK